MESCQIYFITKLKYNLRKLNTEGLVRSSLVINCCNTAVECLHGCSIKKIFSHGYFENGNYRTFFIRKIEPHEIQTYTGIYDEFDIQSRSFSYVNTLCCNTKIYLNVTLYIPSPFTPFEKRKKKTPQSYKICFLKERNPLELMRRYL